MVESNHQCQEAFHNSTLLSQTFMHNENLNQLVKSANFNKSYASFIAPSLAGEKLDIRGLYHFHSLGKGVVNILGNIFVTPFHPI